MAETSREDLTIGLVERLVDRLVDLGLPEAQRADAAATVARLAEAMGPARLAASMAREVDWVNARGIVGQLVAEGLLAEEHRRDAIGVGVRCLAEARDDDKSGGPRPGRRRGRPGRGPARAAEGVAGPERPGPAA